jgi:subtilisin-like proprotein convertase family protein
VSTGGNCPPPPPRRTATATPSPFPTFPPFNSPTATVTPTASTTPFCNITTFTQDVPVSSFLGTPVVSSLDVPANIPFNQIEVTNVVITAAIPGALNLSLISPQNTVVQLMNGACPSGPPWTAANTGFTFYDGVATPIGSVCPPGLGFYHPVGNLSTLVGQSSAGTWRLLISGADATVSSWGLAFIEGTCGGGAGPGAPARGPAPPPPTPTMTPTAIRALASSPGVGPPGPGGYAAPVGAATGALTGARTADGSLGLLAGWQVTGQLVDIIFKQCLLRLWSVPAGASW